MFLIPIKYRNCYFFSVSWKDPKVRATVWSKDFAERTVVAGSTPDDGHFFSLTKTRDPWFPSIKHPFELMFFCKNSPWKYLSFAYLVDNIKNWRWQSNSPWEFKNDPKSAFSPYNGQKGKGKNFGSTTLRVPESSLTSVLTKPVVA